MHDDFAQLLDIALNVIRGSADSLATIRHAAASRPTRFAITVVALIVGFALGFSFYFQSINEQNIRAALFEEQRIRQTDNMKGLAQQISSELESILGRLQGIANSNYVQGRELSGDRISVLLAESYIPVKDSASNIFILDSNDVVTATVLANDQNYIGLSHSGKDYVSDAKRRLAPVLSRSLSGGSDTSYVVLSYPIVQRESGEYLGLVAASIPLNQIFVKFGSPYVTETDRLLATDRSGTFILADDNNLIGKDFQDGELLQRLEDPEGFQNVFRIALAGESNSFVVDGLYPRERLLVAYPVNLRDETVLILAGSTPTEGIYSKIEDIVSTQRIQTIVMVSAVVASIAVIIYFLGRWGETLQREVKKRTKELETANEKLAAHDRMQSEFINVAAHELRTPVQPLLGIADILDLTYEQEKGGKIEISKAELNLISRNARRLERLSSDLLDVSKIESNSLQLRKEYVDLDQRIEEVIADANSTLRNEKKEKIQILRHQERAPVNINPLVVRCDRARIDQVLSNLILNAIKFTEEGQISIKSEKRRGYVIVSVKDTGTGIHEDMISRLFTKFATRSDSGTGLGLFISKNIIESHGGTIWAENNANGKGATFSFALPLIMSGKERDDSDSQTL